MSEIFLHAPDSGMDMDRDMALDLLRKLNDELERRGASATIYVVGGCTTTATRKA